MTERQIISAILGFVVVSGVQSFIVKRALNKQISSESSDSDEYLLKKVRQDLAVLVWLIAITNGLIGAIVFMMMGN